MAKVAADYVEGSAQKMESQLGLRFRPLSSCGKQSQSYLDLGLTAPLILLFFLEYVR